VESSLPPPSEESFSDSPVKTTNSNSFLLPVNSVYKMTRSQDSVAVDEIESIDGRTGTRIGQLTSGLIIKETPKLLTKPPPPKSTTMSGNSLSLSASSAAEEADETYSSSDNENREPEFFTEVSSFSAVPPVTSDTIDALPSVAPLKKRESLISKVKSI
jgi:hypothetical protein